MEGTQQRLPNTHVGHERVRPVTNKHNRHAQAQHNRWSPTVTGTAQASFGHPIALALCMCKLRQPLSRAWIIQHTDGSGVLLSCGTTAVPAACLPFASAAWVSCSLCPALPATLLLSEKLVLQLLPATYSNCLLPGSYPGGMKKAADPWSPVHCVSQASPAPAPGVDADLQADSRQPSTAGTTSSPTTHGMCWQTVTPIIIITTAARYSNTHYLCSAAVTKEPVKITAARY